MTISAFRRETDLRTIGEAIELADARGLRLDCYATDSDPARQGITVEEALELAAEDPGLITVHTD